jgi:hypothetical protein
MHTTKVLLCAALAAGILQAQAPPPPAEPLTTMITQGFATVRTNIEQAAEKMPADKYTFKIVDSNPNTFAFWVAHAAGSAFGCSAIKGEPRSTTAPSNADLNAMTDKVELTKHLKAAFQVCTDALKDMTDAKALASTQILRTMLSTNIHNNEIYGNMVQYIRAVGQVPPSTENRGRGAAGRGGPPPPATKQ